uniref:Rho GTPase-activating protein 29 n=1 Tax=Periophthalmus magnuspinnatus TaxID=409849 RepID=A0A3B4ASL0_9GOBI
NASTYIYCVLYELKKYLHDDLQRVVQERLSELLRVLKAVIGKHQTLNSVDILGAAGTVIAKVKGINFKEVTQENRKAVFSEIHASIDTLAFTFGNVVSDFLMGDVDSPEVSLSREEEVDLRLQKNDSGVESALLYAKAWSKYIKDLLAWMEKRLAMGETSRPYFGNYAKMAESAKTLAGQQDYMPFSDIYTSAFKNDIEYNQLLIQNAMALQSNKFIQPLQARKNELDKLRKDIKEQWQREQKKMQEADVSLRKARALKTQRKEEYQKAHTSTNRSQEEATNVGNKQLEKKRRLEEEAMQKAEEAQDQYQICLAESGVRKLDLANAKSTILTQIREMVFQCDLTLKAVTVNWFQMQQALNASVPTHYQALSDSAKLYEPGECYAEFVRNLPRNLPKERLHSDSISSDSTRPWFSGSQGSHGGMCSDSESAGGSSESRSMDSPTASPGDFKRRLPRTPSTGTMSSADDLDEREPPSPSDNASSPGPFRNAQMSKAAQTHKLRKLRAPSKCRECDSLVVFHGAECEECSLACHKKCLETLAIQCGHKKLQGRLQLFGIDFAQASRNSSDGIPFIIKKCTSEIESRALNIKGIYRVNGAKSRVEKLCQAFENGKDLVELSELSPHDISNVLKLYLRQLPEPLILYRYYNDFIGLAKECQRVIVEEADIRQSNQTAAKETPSVELNRVMFKIRDMLRQLPPANYRTLRYLIAHLHKVTEQAEENKMTASNLGIIFGPTLVKPRQADAEVSLSSLVDYPYQALMVELLVRHYQTVFDPMPLPGSELSTAGQASPKLTPQEKIQRLSRHSTSLVDIKETAKVYKRYSSVIPSSQILNEVEEVQPGTDRTDGSNLDKTNGIQTSAGSLDPQKSTPVFGRPTVHSSTALPSTTMAQKVQLRAQRTRQLSRPISMPLERLPTPAQISERNNRNMVNANLSNEVPEPEKVRSSRVSTYYITPFIDTQTMQRRTWDRKYKHYDVTPRTAMIVANSTTPGQVKPNSSVPTATASSAAPTTGTVTNVFSTSPYAVSLKSVWTKRELDTENTDPSSSPKVPLTLRAPRTLQPPPGTFYKPPGSTNSRARTIPSWTSIITTTTATTTIATTSPTQAIPDKLPTSPTEMGSPQSKLEAQDSIDSAIDTPASPSPPQSPPPGSPDETSPSENKNVYQRLRPRRLPELEHREAHFV